MPGNTAHRVKNPRLRPYRTQPGRDRRNVYRRSLYKSVTFTWMGVECMKTERWNCLGASPLRFATEYGTVEEVQPVDRDWFHKLIIVFWAFTMNRGHHRQYPPSFWRKVSKFMEVVIHIIINTVIQHGFYGGFLAGNHADIRTIKAVIRAVAKAVVDFLFEILDSDILEALVELVPLFQLFHN